MMSGIGPSWFRHAGRLVPLAAIVGTVALVLSSPARSADAAPDKPSASLFAAIRLTECGPRDKQVGDGGAAHGPYHIHREYWRDACRHGGVNWSYDRLAWSDWHCRMVMTWYWEKYGAETDPQRARMHNGGCKGWRSAAALAYWRKVQHAMNQVRA